MDIWFESGEAHIFTILGIVLVVLIWLTPKFENLFWPFMAYMLYMFFYAICFLVCVMCGLMPYLSALRVLGLFLAFIGFKGVDVLVDLMIGKG